ncbi:MAG TPA: hypothetical protein VEQ63_07780 [Bryobacteraceae bacterium]|nr:hypothetical protein [Bryobacteraceae bacterium]
MSATFSVSDESGFDSTASHQGLLIGKGRTRDLYLKSGDRLKVTISNEAVARVKEDVPRAGLTAERVFHVSGMTAGRARLIASDAAGFARAELDIVVKDRLIVLVNSYGVSDPLRKTVIVGANVKLILEYANDLYRPQTNIEFKSNSWTDLKLPKAIPQFEIIKAVRHHALPELKILHSVLGHAAQTPEMVLHAFFVWEEFWVEPMRGVTIHDKTIIADSNTLAIGNAQHTFSHEAGHFLTRWTTFAHSHSLGSNDLMKNSPQITDRRIRLSQADLMNP